MPRSRIDPAGLNVRAVELDALPARCHRAFNDRDLDVWREVLDADVELVVDGLALRGVDAAVSYGVQSLTQFPDLYIDSERIVADSDGTVITELRLVRGDPATGRVRDQGTACEICRVRDGRIVSCRGYYMAERTNRTDAAREPADGEAARIADEQAGLRRVATLVAQGVPPGVLFGAVAREVGTLLDADLAGMTRYVGDDGVAAVAAWAAEGGHPPVPGVWPIDGDRLSPAILRTGRPAREDDWGSVEGPSGAFIRDQMGVRCSVASPIVVEGRVWGGLWVHSTTTQALPADTESRLGNFTELVATAISNAQARDDADRLAHEQAALRRVATLVARESSPEDIFAAVAQEVGQLLGIEDSRMVRYDGDGTATVVASWGRLAAALPVGTRITLDGVSASALVFRTGRAARIEEFADAPGDFAAELRRLGVRSAVGAPIVVGGQLWGAMSTASLRPEPVPADTEARMREFAELVATAISNTEARLELAASRARIVASADSERRRVVRDLHDGAQQRLVHTVVTLKLAQGAFDHDRAAARAHITDALGHAEQATHELRELSHGIMPAVLTRGGLLRGVEALAERSPVPVHVDVSVGRLPATIEAAGYFVVAESLTNVAKHAHATGAAVSARLTDGLLRIDVRDDGVGGARADGSGLLGLHDRLSVLGGRLRVDCSEHGGTLVRADIPLSR